MSLVTSIDLRPISSTRKMWTGMAASGALHVGIALFVAVGLPQLFRADPPELTVSVDIVNLDEISELASLPADQIGPVESAEESKPVEEVDEVARPQPSTAQPAPAVAPTPPQPTEVPTPEPAVQPAAASEAVPEPPAATSEPAPAEPALPQPSAVAEPEPPRALEAAPQISAVAPEPQPTPDPQPMPEPQPLEAAEPTPPDSVRPVPEPEAEAAEPAEEEAVTTGVLPLPSPPRPRDMPEPEPQPQAEPAEATPPPSAVRAQDRPEEPVDDLLAGVLRNVDRNLKPSVTEPQQAARSNAEVTQSVDLTRKAAALGQMIRGQMQRCWRIDPGARSAERLRVSVRVRLRPDGTLVSPPEFQNIGQMSDNAYYRAAAESARRAILECQPFKLPQEDYDLWQDLILNFDPREMF
ncbi:MAG: hypothetical protein WD341_08075 [Tistlia sp.]|uniref:hypothetical protein n=1 Tax=Tistlia sp. TaxID=3057121 RepID=UPI0034A2FB04